MVGDVLMREADQRRHRLARLLHDGPAQTLAAAVMSLELVDRDGVTLGPAAREALASTRQLLQQTAHDLSQLASAEFPAFLGEGGLLTAVSALARRSGDRLVVDSESTRPLPPLGPAIELGAFRLLERAVERGPLPVPLFAPGEPITARFSLVGGARLTLRLVGAGAPGARNLHEVEALRTRARLAGGRLALRRTARQLQIQITFAPPAPTSRRRGQRRKEGGGP
jgi:signal transduction histidine kinase